MQRVIFRKFKVGPPDVIAFFLDQPERQGPNYCMAYMHNGQHGTGTYPHIQTEPASPTEYADLLAELKSIGYDDLRVVRRGKVAPREK